MPGRGRSRTPAGWPPTWGGSWGPVSRRRPPRPVVRYTTSPCDENKYRVIKPCHSHVMSCHVIPCHVVPCHTSSICSVFNHVMVRHWYTMGTPYYAMPHRVIPCHTTMSCLTVSCLTMSCLTMSCRTISCRTISCRTTSYHVVSCHAVPIIPYHVTMYLTMSPCHVVSTTRHATR